MLTAAQKTVLKNHILNTPSLAAKANSGDYEGVANELNANFSPDFWCWRTAVTKEEYCCNTSQDNTNWSWPAYIARSLQEQNAWQEMFSTGMGAINPSLDNVRQGFLDIFSGSASNAPAQRTHCQSISRRKATVAEKLLATGTGTTASPGKFTFQGMINTHSIGEILS